MLARTGFGHLHYDLLGGADAPVVCMLHSLTSDSGMWAEQVPALLDAGFQVLRIDMRGHGGSSAAPDDYSIEMLAGDVLSILDRLEFPAVHLVGLSIGGMIGQAIAADHRGRLLSLTACATTARWEGNSELMNARLAAVRATGTLESIVEDNMEHRYSPALRSAQPHRCSALRETFLGTSLEGYFGAMHAVLHHDVLDRLEAVEVPTLVVAGSDDEITPPGQNRRIAETIKGARYVEIAGGRHFLTVEFSDTFNPILLEWLAKVEAGTGRVAD